MCLCVSRVFSRLLDTVNVIPAQLKKREIVYRHMLADIAPGQSLTEGEINERIHRFHADHCTIRRDMISEGIMKRDGTQYTSKQ